MSQKYSSTDPNVSIYMFYFRGLLLKHIQRLQIASATKYALECFDLHLSIAWYSEITWTFLNITQKMSSTDFMLNYFVASNMEQNLLLTSLVKLLRQYYIKQEKCLLQNVILILLVTIWCSVYMSIQNIITR